MACLTTPHERALTLLFRVMVCQPRHLLCRWLRRRLV